MGINREHEQYGTMTLEEWRRRQEREDDKTAVKQRRPWMPDA